MVFFDDIRHSLFVCFNINIVKEVDMIFKATGDVYIVQYDETHSAKKWERERERNSRKNGFKYLSPSCSKPFSFVTREKYRRISLNTWIEQTSN